MRSIVTPWPCHAARIGDHAMLDLRQHEARILRSDPDVAAERALEGAADDPALQGADDRDVEIEQRLHGALTALDEGEIVDVLGPDPDLADVAARGPGLPIGTPDRGAHVGILRELAEDVAQALVHLVVGGVVFVGSVVADESDRTGVFEGDQIRTHGVPFRRRAQRGFTPS
jgi:hypothetical protein